MFNIVTNFNYFIFCWVLKCRAILGTSCVLVRCHTGDLWNIFTHCLRLRSVFMLYGAELWSRNVTWSCLKHKQQAGREGGREGCRRSLRLMFSYLYRSVGMLSLRHASIKGWEHHHKKCLNTLTDSSKASSTFLSTQSCFYRLGFSS